EVHLAPDIRGHALAFTKQCLHPVDGTRFALADVGGQMYFLIVLLDFDDQFTLVATYIPEASYARRQWVFEEIINSVEPMQKVKQ
ncbi:MAG: hypothetical protein AAFX99_10905, partial [Myxococcota bacterium]